MEFNEEATLYCICTIFLVYSLNLCIVFVSTADYDSDLMEFFIQLVSCFLSNVISLEGLGLGNVLIDTGEEK